MSAARFTAKGDDLLRVLRARPAVHRLAHSCFLQETVKMNETLFAVPLAPLQFVAETESVSRYGSEVLGVDFPGTMTESFRSRGDRRRPVVSIVSRHRIDADPESLEALALPRIERAQRVLSWISSDPVFPFANVILTETETWLRAITPGSRRRQWLEFNGRKGFEETIPRLMQRAEEDDRFDFALSLFGDAMQERNLKFRVARFFNCLECLAFRVKQAGLGSRDAVRYLLGLEEGEWTSGAVKGREYRFDAIELGGRIRNHLFHGSSLSAKRLRKDLRDSLWVYHEHPEIIAESLMPYCQLELSRWASGESGGQGEVEI